MRKKTSNSESEVTQPQTSLMKIHDAAGWKAQDSDSTPPPSPAGSLEGEDRLMDPALDELLLQAHQPQLRDGFADRVVQSVQPSVPTSLRRRSVSVWLAGLAAAIAICAVSLVLTQPRSESGLRPVTPIDEESLVAALRSPELSGEDLALVAKLGEVLEAELIANHPLWLDEK